MDQMVINAEEGKKAPIDDLLQKLSSSPKGLAASEANKRVQQYGYNEISEKKLNPLLKLLSYFWGPIPWMIEVAAILSAVVHHWEDFWIIFVLLLLNAVVGFWQEHKADNAIELLKQKLAPKARVLRDGKWIEVDARELVPGDVARVRLGVIVPADLKLLSGDYLLIDESALTGESMPVEKHVSDVAYSGSIARQGEMNGLVIATGMNTYLGRTARLVEEAESRSHFQKAVIKIGDYLIVLALALVAVIFLVALYRHESMLQTLQFALILTVAAIPAALPAVLSVTMAVGATALAKKEAIVSKLAAIEEMAGMDILCSDKTGTITQNKITVGEIKPFEGFEEAEALLFATLTSREEDQDPIDDAIIARAKMVGGMAGVSGRYKVIEFTPFDPVSKRAVVTVEDTEGDRFKVAKGAPQAILALVANKETVSAQVDEQVNALATKGYRPLGVARTTDAQQPWQYAGILGLYDPPREDSAETIRTAQAMGVQVKMVTGDHAGIAKQIAQQVNLGTNIMPASSFLDKPDREARRVVEGADGFAQVFPEHKYHIVELLQAKGHIVGMTGDGVNDAPALKKADAGIAVAGATDAAKSAADIVLTRPGLSVIIDAIKESRKIFQRMNSYAIYRIAETIRVLFFITLSILVFNFYPVTAVMIVLLAVLNDGAILSIAYDCTHYSNQPEAWNMRMVLGMATVLGITGVLASFGLFYLGEHIFRLSRDMIQSFMYLKLSIAGHLTIFITRTRGPFWSFRPAPVLLGAVVITQLMATFIAVYGLFMSPIGWSWALLVWGYAITWFLLNDRVKLAAYRIFDPQQPGFLTKRVKR
ncbi:MAG TPA: plasma-membrane proton-efflux P-type ATPase [Proteobacteria bacterium]|nr:plasma-membrane proton-efflux P-type ATPase [Pseudomonadota bacterium]